MTIGIMSLCVFDVPKVVRSPGCDHGHDEESRNGRDMKIDILEVKEIYPRGNNKVLYISLYHDKCLLFMLELY